MIDMEKFRQSLGKLEVDQRYKIKHPKTDVGTMLEECYKFSVARRRRTYDSKYVLPLIHKVAKWLTEQDTDGLLLYGTVGSGKSTMAEAIRTVLQMVGKGSKQVTAIALSDVAKLPEKYDFEMLKNCEILFIDDMGEEQKIVKSFGNEVSPIVETIYYRYDKQKMTIITSNLLEEEIKERYGPRVLDRFEEMFDKIYFDHDSYRTNKSNK